MNSNKNIIIGVIVFVAIVLIGWLVLKDRGGDSVDGTGTSISPSTSMMTPSTTPTPTVKPSVSATPKPVVHTVQLTAQGVSPKTLTIRRGDAVMFTNQTGTPWWLSSSCSGFDSARGLGINESYTLTFGTATTCTYNNHLDTYNTAYQGTIVIQ